jgi:recombination protein RecT
MRSGAVSLIHADAIFPGDEFECVHGSGGHLTHKPLGDRIGRPLRFYSFVKLRDGGESYDVMSLKEVELIRKRSKSPDQGPWVTDFNEMGKKTVFRRHTKWLPLSPEARFTVDRSDPEAIDVTNTWGDMIGEGEDAPQRLSARDKVLNAPQLPAHDGSGTNEPDGTPPQQSGAPAPPEVQG